MDRKYANFKKLTPLKNLLMLLVITNICGRLLLHPPNVTPSISLSLLSGIYFSYYTGYFSCLISNFISDLLLHNIMDYSIFGNWSFFTYSGFLAISYLGSKITSLNIRNITVCILISSFSFWVWTNFGVWLLDHLYPQNLFGLLMCYKLALPFLKNAILGDLFWMLIIFTLGLRLVGNNTTFFNAYRLPLKYY